MPRRLASSLTQTRARELRQSMNRAESLLWARLRNGRVGFKFRRQHPVGPYILDFFCMEAMLAVELDGSTHFGREAHDASRDSYIASLGIQTSRYPNGSALEALDDLVNSICAECETRAGRSRTYFTDS